MPSTRQKCCKANNTNNINDILSDDTNHEKTLNNCQIAQYFSAATDFLSKNKSNAFNSVQTATIWRIIEDTWKA